MNWIKKIAIITMMFLSSFVYSQNGGYKILGSSDYYQWIKVDEPRCGKGSFYIYISKEYNISSRLYYYKIFLWSDSYYRNCGVASTLIDVFNVYIYANGTLWRIDREEEKRRDEKGKTTSFCQLPNFSLDFDGTCIILFFSKSQFFSSSYILNPKFYIPLFILYSKS